MKKRKKSIYFILIETTAIITLIIILLINHIPIIIYEIPFNLQVILTILSVITSTSAFIIIIWDHIIDDKKSAKRIQVFYENIEKFIFYYYEQNYFQAYSNLTKNQEDKKKCDKLESKYKFYKLVFKRDFVHYSPFIGLVKEIFRSNFEQENRYINETENCLTPQGCIYASDGFLNSGAILKENVIKIINDFLRSLRHYWNINYSKSILKIIKIKPRLKKNLNFLSS